MINREVINAMMDLIDENIRLIEEIRSHGYESFSNGWKRLPKGEPIRQFDRITGLTGLKYKKYILSILLSCLLAIFNP